MYVLTPMQIALIRARIRDATNTIGFGDSEKMHTRGVVTSVDSGLIDAGETKTKMRRLLTNSEFKEVKTNAGVIGIGSMFSLVSSDNKSESFFLVKSTYGLTAGKHFPTVVSSESKLGQSVMDKESGKIIQFQNEEGELQDYRIQIETREDLYPNFIIDYPSAELPFDRKIILTPSQVEILRDERCRQENLCGSLKEGDNENIKYLKNCINKGELKLPPDDESIGIGSRVTLLFDNKIEVSYELIDKAYSTEIDTEYIEANSELGRIIFGKKVGDEFSYSVPLPYPFWATNIRGKVIGVNNERPKIKDIKFNF